MLPLHKHTRPLIALLLALAALLALTAAPFANTICPMPAPAGVSDQKAGSILVFPFYTSASDGAFSGADTLLQITNVSNGAAVSGGAPNYQFLHLFFINGANCSPADTFVCLTPNGSVQIKASDYDPTVTGYLIAIAVDAQGRPIANNAFVGSAYVRDESNRVIGSYGAEALLAVQDISITAIFGSSCVVRQNVVPAPYGQPTGSPQPDGSVALQFYEPAPSQFSAQVQDPAAADEVIVLASYSGDLGTRLVDIQQSGVGVAYRADEAPASFQPQLGAGCLLQRPVESASIRIVPGSLGSFLRDSYGYLKFNTTAPAFGLLISKQGAQGQAANRFAGIRALHKTGYTSPFFFSLRVPCFPPFCGF
jgi:hypothetical protein